MEKIQKLDYNKNVKFVKLYTDIIEELSKTVTSTEFMFIIRLSNYISYDDCILRKNGHANGLILSAKEIAKGLNMNYDTTRKIMTSLYRLDILKKTKIKSREKDNVLIKVVICNPWIFSKGNKVSMDILELFEDSVWKNSYAPESDDRLSYEYAKWKKLVLERDNYTCQCCGLSSCELEVHHKENYMENIDLRVSVDNGICLCRNCHNTKVKGSFHNIYGTHSNNSKQLDDYIEMKRTK